MGEGPVQVILNARAKGGPFASLADFCDRADLRKVGKRPIECLIKVGALDRFGKRSQLLAVMDQMVAASGNIHGTRESGQLSMFDLMGESAAMEAQPIVLPDVEEAKGRERLTWEKELLGVYAMSHPLQHVGIDLEKIVTCACNELSEAHDGHNVTLAGMISSVRTITTKKGDPMAFVQIEDLKGQCEVVVFPRTYAEVKEKLAPDTVVLVKGKAQSREGQTSLLADSFQNYVDQAVAVAEEETKYQKPLFEVTPTINGMAARNNMVAVHETAANYSADYGDSYDYLPTGEASPFENDLPSWEDGDAADPNMDAADDDTVAAVEADSESATVQPVARRSQYGICHEQEKCKIEEGSPRANDG
ncbi:MAG: OB-fold nucleic acid binding domain-containing protein [Caldilineaceae bacterium]